MISENSQLGRRDALKLGGLTVSLAALVAACGDDRGGSTAGGRIGFDPPTTDLADYAVDDAALLRTIASVELSVVAAYEGITSTLDGALATLVARFVEDHRQIAQDMDERAVAAGGAAWGCANPWFMNRYIEPLLTAIAESDAPGRDSFNAAVALENLAAATNQAIALQFTDGDAMAAALAAATLESRQSAALVSSERGPVGFVSPSLDGTDPEPDDDGVPVPFAVPWRFGSIGQIELMVGKPDVNGVRQTLVLQTPAANSYIYNELTPSC